MTIKLGTFNLFQFVEPPYSWYSKKEKFTNEQWLKKITWIKNQIIKMDCDIIGFQEVFSKDALKSLVNQLGFKYFQTVDTAKLSQTNNKVYVSTTVAIASKYPITNMQEVKVHLSSIKKHNFDGVFNYSRIPIKASIILPNKIELLVYVCHLKSNRLNEFEYEFNESHSLEHKKELVFKKLQNTSNTSLKQRLCEASCLFHDIQNHKKTPLVLLCDLNDKEFSISIDALSNNYYHNDKSKETLILYDASYEYKKEVYNPKPNQKKVKRKNTSYFQTKGSVLDYIFISNDFIKKNKNRIAQVSNYHIINHHLQKNTNGSLFKSDHAQVVCELTFI